MSTTWRDILADYIARINDKAYDRLMEEWPSAGLPNGSRDREVERLADIHTNFIKFADSRPNACEHMMEKLLNVRQSLMENIHDDIGDVRDAIGTWIDPVAIPFRNYLGDCETALEWHRDYVNAMSAIADLQREIVHSTRDDVRNIADTLLEALDQPVDDGSSFSLGDAFKVAGAVVAVAALVATPGPDEAIGIAFLNGALSAATSTAEAGAAVLPSEIAGERTIDILESAYDELAEVAAAVEQQESAVIAALQALFYDIVENEAELVPQRQQVDPNSVPPNEVRMVHPSFLRTAARVNLPAAAGANRSAALHLASIEEHEQFAFQGDLHDGPLGRWRSRREELQRILGDIATELEDMAATLESIASSYEDNEAAQVEGFSRISARLESS